MGVRVRVTWRRCEQVIHVINRLFTPGRLWTKAYVRANCFTAGTAHACRSSACGPTRRLTLVSNLKDISGPREAFGKWQVPACLLKDWKNGSPSANYEVWSQRWIKKIKLLVKGRLDLIHFMDSCRILLILMLRELDCMSSLSIGECHFHIPAWIPP